MTKICIVLRNVLHLLYKTPKQMKKHYTTIVVTLAFLAIAIGIAYTYHLYSIGQFGN